jgi:hypothetical protein
MSAFYFLAGTIVGAHLMMFVTPAGLGKSRYLRNLNKGTWISQDRVATRSVAASATSYICRGTKR